MGVPRKVEQAILSIGLGAALSCSAGRSTEAPATAPAVAQTLTARESAPSATAPAPKVDLTALLERERPPLPLQPIADPKGR